MMQSIEARLAALYPVRDEQLRAAFLLLVQGVMIILVSLLAFVILPRIDRPQIYPFVLLITGCIVASFVLLAVRQLTAASILLIAPLIAGSILVNLSDGFRTGFEVATVSVLIILSGLLLSVRGVAIVSLVLIPIVLVVNLRNPDPTVPQPVLGEIYLSFIFSIVAVTTFGFLRVAAASRKEGEAEGGEERFKLAELTTRMTRLATQRSNMNEALYTALNLILTNYSQFYHAQVFIIGDDGVQAELVASTGDAGRKLLAEGHALAVGSFSVIGQATFKGEPVIAVADDPNTIHRPNPLLPETRVEIAFPMKIEERIIGVLDLQSREKIQLGESERFTFQTLANSLSLVIDNVRQFEKAELSVRENQRLAEQSRNALREVERLNQRLIGRAWSDYLKSYQSQLGVDFDFEAHETETGANWTKTLIDAARTNSLVQDDGLIALPLRVGGHVVGALEFEVDDAAFSPEDLELVQDVSGRFGLAVENMRLVDESQRIAQRETLINEITNRLQGYNNVEVILTEALRSVNETLQASKVSIRLGVPASEEN